MMIVLPSLVKGLSSPVNKVSFHTSRPKVVCFQSQLQASISQMDNETEDESENNRVLARIRRRNGRSDYRDDDDDDEYYLEDESVSYAADLLEDEGILEDLDEFDNDDDDDDESYDTFSNTVIPNQILDSIDPDGAADRFPELASDPRFWFDLFLFIVFLDFVSFIGPRNPFLDVIPEMYTAGLPPPGL